MDELPRIDPSWTRRRQAPPPKDGAHLVVVLVSLLALVPGIWLVRAHAESKAARQAAASRSLAEEQAARRRQAEELEEQRTPIRYITEAQADREIAAANGTSPGGDAIHHCVVGSTRVYQSAPCNSYRADASAAKSYSRQENVAEQARMRARAEAMLAAEQQRFAALTGQQQGGSWQAGPAPTAVETARQHCEWVKAQRDEAYRVVGKDRTFDFIRSWTDRVAEACKNS